MSDEENIVQTDVSVEETAPVLSIEDKARAMGWRPLEEFKGDPDAWVESKEFVSRGSFFRKIEDLKQQLKTQEQVLKTVHATMTQTEHRAYEQAVKDVKAQMQEARMAGDFQAYEDAVHKQAELLSNQTAPAAPATETVAQIRSTDDWKAFELQNDWLTKTDVEAKIKQSAASILVTNFEQQNPNATTKEKYAFVHREIRNKFPNDFKTTAAPSPVASVGRSSSSSSEYSSEAALANFSEAQKQAIRYYQENKYDTKELMNQFRKGKK